MAKRRVQIGLLAILVAALMVGPVGAETLVVSAARMLDVTNGSVTLVCRTPGSYAALVANGVSELHALVSS